MYQGIKKDTKQKNEKITTIKLSQSTKDRIDKLRIYRRETYDEILQNIINLLNLFKINPDAARSRLALIDRKKRKEFRLNSFAQNNFSDVSTQKSSAPQHYQPQGRATRSQ